MTKKTKKTLSLTSLFLTVLASDSVAMELGQPPFFEEGSLSSRSLILSRQGDINNNSKETELKKNIWDRLGIWLKPKRAGEIRLNNLIDYAMDETKKSHETKKMLLLEGTLSSNDLSRLMYLKSVMVSGIQGSTPTVWSRRQQEWKCFSENDKKKACKIIHHIDQLLQMNQPQLTVESDYAQTLDSIFNRNDMLMIRLLLAGSYEIHPEEVSGGIQKRILKISEMLKKLVGENQVSHKGNPDIVYLSYLSIDHRVRENVHGIFELSKNGDLSTSDIKYILRHLQDLENSITSYNVNQAKSGFLKKLSTVMGSLSSQEVLQIIGSCLEEVDSIKRLAIEILIRQDRDFIEYYTRMAQLLEDTYKKRLDTYADKTEINILSVDGGGIRGLIPASLIKIIEAETGKPITELFDFFAGTSTGGIIAVGLTTPTYVGGETPKYDPLDVLELYTTKGEQIFPPLSSTMKKIFQAVNTAYNPQTIEGLFATYFSHYPLSSAVKPTIVIVGDLTRGQKTILSSVKAIEEPESDILMRHAVRATSAAPTYFPPITVWHEGGIKEYVDGGIMANNPVKEALDEARKCYPNATTINIISFGTGTSPYGYEYGHTNVGLVGGALQSFKLVKRDNARSAEKELKESYIPLLEQTGKHITFRRINPEIATKISLDEASPENIQRLELAAKEAASCPEFKELIEFLRKQAK